MSLSCVNGVLSPVSRAYLRPITLFDRRITSSDIESGNLEIYSASGSLIGIIRGDCRDSIIQNVSFSYGVNGCAELSFTLGKIPDVKIRYGSIVRIKALNTLYNWFSGTIKESPEDGTKQDAYEYRAVGFTEYLSWLVADTTYPAPIDPGEMVKDLLINWIAPFSPIGYNSSKILTNTGVVTTNQWELSKMPIQKTLDALADLSDCSWFVDGDGELNFVKNNSPIRKTFFEGCNISSFEPSKNYDEIKNVITVIRSQPKTSGKNGWVVAGVYTDETSIAKYGRLAEDYTAPGWISDEDAENLGAALIERYKEPSQTAKIDSVAIRDSGLWLAGQYRVITDAREQWTEYDPLDDVLDWSINNTGDLSLSEDPLNLVYGSKSIKFEFQNAINSYAVFTKNTNYGLVKKFRIAIRGSKIGQYISLGYGETSYFENIAPIDITISNKFLEIEIECEPNVRKIGQIAIIIDKNMDSLTSVWVDDAEALIQGHNTYLMRLSRHGYKFTPNGNTSWAEFGPQKPRLENYIKTLDAQSKEFKFTQEIR